MKIAIIFGIFLFIINNGTICPKKILRFFCVAEFRIFGFFVVLKRWQSCLWSVSYACMGFLILLFNGLAVSLDYSQKSSSSFKNRQMGINWVLLKQIFSKFPKVFIWSLEELTEAPSRDFSGCHDEFRTRFAETKCDEFFISALRLSLNDALFLLCRLPNFESRFYIFIGTAR